MYAFIMLELENHIGSNFSYLFEKLKRKRQAN